MEDMSLILSRPRGCFYRLRELHLCCSQESPVKHHDKLGVSIIVLLSFASDTTKGSGVQIAVLRQPGMR
jgi:hypothetical protein